VSVKGLLLVLGMFFFSNSVVNATENQCPGTSLKAIIPAPSTEAHEILEETAELADLTEANLKECKTSPCMQKVLKKVRSPLKKILEKTCVGRHPAAMNALLMRLSVNEAGWVSTWLFPAIRSGKYDWKQFPAEYVAANLIVLPILVNKNCYSIFESGANGEAIKEFDWNYMKSGIKRSIMPILYMMGGISIANPLIDHYIRKTDHNVADYASKIALLTIEQLGVSSPANVGLDYFLKRKLPLLAEDFRAAYLPGLRHTAPLTFAAGLGITYGVKVADYSFINFYVKHTQHPFEKLMGMSWHEIESLFEAKNQNLPSNK